MLGRGLKVIGKGQNNFLLCLAPLLHLLKVKKYVQNIKTENISMGLHMLGILLVTLSTE